MKILFVSSLTFVICPVEFVVFYIRNSFIRPKLKNIIPLYEATRMQLLLKKNTSNKMKNVL
jgi:hypothetical protein